MLSRLGLLQFGWLPLHFHVVLHRGHLCLPPTQSPPSPAELQPPASPGCGQTPVPCSTLSSPGAQWLAQHLKFSVPKMFWDHTITSRAKT